MHSAIYQSIPFQVEEEQCKEVEVEKCQEVKEQECQVVDEEVCETVEKETCEEVEEELCEKVKEEKCSVEEKEQCTLEQEEQCRLETTEECRQVENNSQYACNSLVSFLLQQDIIRLVRCSVFAFAYLDIFWRQKFLNLPKGYGEKMQRSF